MAIKRTEGRWYVSRCGELRPDEYMITSDIGKTESGANAIKTIGRVFNYHGHAKKDAKFIGIACRNHEELVRSISLLVNSFMIDNPDMSDAEIEENYPHIVDAIKLMEKIVEEHKEEI